MGIKEYPSPQEPCTQPFHKMNMSSDRVQILLTNQNLEIEEAKLRQDVSFWPSMMHIYVHVY